MALLMFESLLGFTASNFTSVDLNFCLLSSASFMVKERSCPDMIMAESTKSSWKDEIITIVVLAPCVMAWIDPDLAKRGFDVIAELPDWYQNILYVTILAGLGLKGLDRFRKK